ncbi:glutathione S-transferase family protein [Pseudomonas profundi]|uniref:glutathione S-transferase family protein n=1 Tax=Pseudomonas profundi TaxID=1981513 RepID=UPI001238FAD0|nr:glutathione S-transferase family protein [Pseudomonas profundi]
MALTLYGAILSPFVRKVRILLAEVGQEYELVTVNPFGQPDWYYKINPLGRVPAIQDGNLTLADSAVIAQYLHESRGSSLYGTNPEQAARIRWLEKYADYEVAPFATFTVFYNRVVRPLKGETTDEQLVSTAFNETLPPLFDYLEAQLGDNEYLVGERFSMADIAVACQLINFGHGGETLDPQRWPGLAGLLERVSTRPSIADRLTEERGLLAKIAARSAQKQPS